MAEFLLIKNAQIVSDKDIVKSDIFIVDGIIEKVESTISQYPENTKIIDAKNQYVFPGAIDAHVHFQLPTPAGPSSDDFYTGSRAALSGGTTTIIDFITPRIKQNLIDAFEQRYKEAENSITDFSLHQSITWWDDSCRNQMDRCINELGITSFKTYMAYKGVVGIEDVDLIKAMHAASENGGLITSHCENGDLINFLRNDFIKNNKTQAKYHVLSRPNIAESEAINRIITYAKYTGCKLYIVHVSAAQSLELIKKAQLEGFNIKGETCPHYLVLDDSAYEQDNAKAIGYVLSPPLRSKNDNEALWKAISENVIQVMATDHCPFNLKGQKDIGLTNFTRIPNGGNGLENRLQLIFHYGVNSKLIDIKKFVEINCVQPAKIFGMYPRKGAIQKGADADIVIWNNEKNATISAKTQYQNCDYSIFEGFETKGIAQYVIKGGEIVVEDYNWIEPKVKGSYIKRKL